LDAGFTVFGKSPIFNRWFAGVAQLVERHLAKVAVVGSSPITRSHQASRTSPVNRMTHAQADHRSAAVPVTNWATGLGTSFAALVIGNWSLVFLFADGMNSVLPP
jgi:hypothetical protein